MLIRYLEYSSPFVVFRPRLWEKQLLETDWGLTVSSRTLILLTWSVFAHYPMKMLATL